MNKRSAESNEKEKLLSKNEDHFLDFKSKLVTPSKAQETFVAFANTDGGDLYIGIEDGKSQGERINGFNNLEEANDILKVLLEETDPSVENIDIEFIDFDTQGIVLHITIPKSPKVHFSSQGKCFIRINARKEEIKGEKVLSLGYAKGTYQYEKQIVRHVDITDILNSNLLQDYMNRIETELQPELFLRKQRLIEKDSDDTEFKPNVCCVLLFDEEPQATLNTRCSIKLYRLRTTSNSYDRKYLEGRPQTINGCLEEVINKTLDGINELLESTLYKVNGELKKRKYPVTAIKEILVNAVIHRDYSLGDDIHVIIFDDRIEIKSPGKLPGFITVENIYDERYSRNPNIVRMLHKLPDPPNHDIGEGLDTARNELQEVGLVPPIIQELENSVLVTIKHTRIATIEQVIRDLFRQNENMEITNRQVRLESGERNINVVKKSLQRLRALKYIRPKDPNCSPFKFSYVLDERGHNEWIKEK